MKREFQVRWDEAARRVRIAPADHATRAWLEGSQEAFDAVERAANNVEAECSGIKMVPEQTPPPKGVEYPSRVAARLAAALSEEIPDEAFGVTHKSGTEDAR